MFRKYILLTLLICILLITACTQGISTASETGSSAITDAPVMIGTEQGMPSDNECTASEKINLPDTEELNSLIEAFFEAYIFADIESAKKLMDSSENECLEYFPDTPKLLEMCSPELITEKQVYDGDTSYTVVAVDVPLYDKYLGDIFYMCLTLKKENTDGSNWAVTNFDFEP